LTGNDYDFQTEAVTFLEEGLGEVERLTEGEEIVFSLGLQF